VVFRINIGRQRFGQRFGWEIFVKIDIQQIRELLAIVSENDVAELTVEVGEEKVTIKKATTAVTTVLAAPAPESVSVRPVARELSFDPQVEVPVEQANKHASDSEKNFLAVTSPMVGTFYRSASPTSAPYVQVGDNVAVGQTVCIIEAMKLMNDMPSEVAGRVVKVCVENGSTVEYGQQLFLVDPKV
jgi:acetyl-CoA carboxylase biotin carboxyl carrier protein